MIDITIKPELLNYLQQLVSVVIFCVFLSPMVNGQNAIFEIKDDNSDPLVSALVTLHYLETGKKYNVFTEKNGFGSISNLDTGKYRLEVVYLGYEELTDTIYIKHETQRFVYILQTQGQVMDEISIIAKKPLIRQEGDKTIVDPEPLLGFSTNTLEVLEATPGLIVDPDGGIFLNNANPAAIYINGREQRIGTQDIMNILRSLPPGNILRIEIIRNPSTKYDASSTGGIINIVLKKGVKLGQYGSISSGMNQGKAGNRFGGFTYNNTRQKSGYSFQLNYNRDAANEDISAVRSTKDISDLHQINQNQRRNQNIFTALGFDHTFKRENQFNYFGTFQVNLNTLKSDQTNFIQNQEMPDFLSNNIIENNNPFYSHRHDLGWIKKLDTIGSEIEGKCSVGQSFFNGRQTYIYDVIFPVNNSIKGMGDILNQRNYLSAQIDFTKRWGRILLMESGLKSDIQEFQSSTNFGVSAGIGYIPDSTRSNQYQYRDYIHGAYLQLTKDFPWKITLKSGIRAEMTKMVGQEEIPKDTSFQINRTDLFPYLYISRELFTIAGYIMKGFAIYRKSINRPTYQNLNPAIQILDPFNYSSGNPGLAPQFTDNYEFNISFDDNPIFAIGRNFTTGIISNVLYEDPELPGQTFNTFDNIGKSKETYFRLVGAIPPGGKYFFVAGAQYNHSEYEGTYNGQPISFDRGSWRFFTFHNLKITKNMRFNLFGFVMVNGQQNLMTLRNFGQLNLTLHHSFLANKLQVSIFGRDIFRTMETTFLLNQGGILFEGSRYSDNQRVGITIRYNFGISGKKESKNMFDIHGTE